MTTHEVPTGDYMKMPDNPYEAMIDAFWNEIQPTVITTLDHDTIPAICEADGDKAVITADKKPGTDQVDEAARRERMLASEKKFVYRVLGDVLRLSDGDPRSTLVLFDLDQTLVSRKSRDEGTEGSVVRPSAVPLLLFLYKYGYTVGILTSRGTTDIMSGLIRPDDVQSVSEFIDRNYVLGVDQEDIGSIAVDAAAELSVESFAVIQPILNDEYRSKQSRDNYDAFRFWVDRKGKGFPVKDVIKLEKLADLNRQNPSVRYIVVDDREYAAQISTDPSVLVKGIQLAEDERAHF